MKTQLLQMAKANQLTDQKIEIYFKSGKHISFDLSTDKLDLDAGSNYIHVYLGGRKFLIDTTSVEMFIVG